MSSPDITESDDSFVDYISPQREPRRSYRFEIGLALFAATAFVLAMLGRAYLRLPPFEGFWEISEDAWLGFAGSIIAAILGGLVAGLVLITQLRRQENDLLEQIRAQGRLQLTALSVQRDEARRGREMEVISELVPFLTRPNIAVHGLFTAEDEAEFDRLSLRWIPNSGLSLEDSKSLPRYLRCMFGMIAYYEAHRDDRRIEVTNGRYVQTFDDEDVNVRISPALKNQLVHEVRNQVGQLLTIPSMTAQKKQEFIGGLMSVLVSKSQVNGHTLNPLMNWPRDDDRRIYES